MMTTATTNNEEYSYDGGDYEYNANEGDDDDDDEKESEELLPNCSRNPPTDRITTPAATVDGMTNTAAATAAATADTTALLRRITPSPSFNESIDIVPPQPPTSPGEERRTVIDDLRQRITPTKQYYEADQQQQHQQQQQNYPSSATQQQLQYRHRHRCHHPTAILSATKNRETIFAPSPSSASRLEWTPTPHVADVDADEDDRPIGTITTPSKFKFVSDQKNIPIEIKKLEETTIQRRRHFVSRIHDLDIHTAKLVSMYGEEHMDLDLATCDTLERTTVQPLLLAIEKLAMHREASMARSYLGVIEVEKSIGTIDAKMAHHTHVKMNDLHVDVLNATIRADIQHHLITELWMETAKHDIIEKRILRRYEDGSGTMLVNLYRECSERRAEMELLRRKIEQSVPEKIKRGQATLNKIAALREQLREQRLLRQTADQSIRDEIEYQTAVMQRAMIAVVSDGNSASVSKDDNE